MRETRTTTRATLTEAVMRIMILTNEDSDSKSPNGKNKKNPNGISRLISRDFTTALPAKQENRGKDVGGTRLRMYARISLCTRNLHPRIVCSIYPIMYARAVLNKPVIASSARGHCIALIATPFVVTIDRRRNFRPVGTYRRSCHVRVCTKLKKRP